MLTSRSFKVHLKPAPSHEDALAWLIEGDDPNRWLTELASWQQPHASLKLCLVPQPGTMNDPAGLLVLSTRTSARAPDPRCQPLRRLGDKLYLPLHSAIQPAIDAAEANQLVRSSLGLLHPIYGLVLFGPDDFVPLHQLISTPAILRTRWNRGVQGTVLNTRLHQIQVPAPPDVGEFISEGGGDIGSEPILDLPEAPDEPSDSPIAKGDRWLRGQVAKGLVRLTDLAPEGAAEPTWVDGVRDWAMHQRDKLNQVDQGARNREIHRLLDLLKKNPEQGLKHAIPFGDQSGRGLAPPGHRLTTNPVDFNLDQLGGGQAMDSWQISWQQQHELMQAYRELANRELRMGNYRRAAYIFGNLLSDLHAAADALAQGGHHREAAVIYKDKLSNARKAAECLEKGGLLTEAIALYAEQGLYEICGDLYRKLDEPEEAEQHFRLAIEQCEGRQRYLEVMRILVEKLDGREEALEVIDRAWPDSGDGVECLMRHFEILAEMGRHEASGQLVRELAERDALGSDTARIVDVYAHLIRHYPVDRLKHLASDTGKVHLGHQLQKTRGYRASEWAALLNKLSPEDRLLQRDTLRYAPQKPKKKPEHKVQGVPNPEGIKLVRRVSLKGLDRVAAVVASGYEFYAMGSSRRFAALLRSDWEGRSRILRWPDVLPKQDVQLVKTASELLVLRYRLPGQEIGAIYSGDPPLPCGTPAWLQPNTVAGCEGLNSCVACLCVTERGYELNEMNLGGHLIRSRDVIYFADLHPHDRHMIRPEMVCLRDHYYFLFGKLLLQFSFDGESKSYELDEPGVQLIASAPNTSPRLVVTFEGGGAQIFWLGDDRWKNTVCTQDLFEQRATFTRNGHLVLMNAEQVHVYDTSQQVLTYRHTLKTGRPEVFLDVVPGEKASQFMEVAKEGVGYIWEVSGR